MKTYAVAAFGVQDEVYCPLTYTIDFPSGGQTWLTQIGDREMQWQTDSNADYGVYTVTIIATGPDDITAQVSYTITVVINCTKKVVTLSTPLDQSHLVGAAKASYEVPEFVNDEPVYCPLSYSITFDTTRTWLGVNAAGSRQMNWEPMQNSEYGDYLITVKGTDPVVGDTYEVSYTLTIIRDCSM